MNKTRNKKLTPISRILRKNMTKEECHLWYDFFKKLSVTVNRQKIIGKYIADFYISEAKIAVELDGSQHCENKYQMISDFERDEFFKGLGITVLRYSNLEIQREFEAVCNDILLHIELITNKQKQNG